VISFIFYFFSNNLFSHTLHKINNNTNSRVPEHAESEISTSYTENNNKSLEVDNLSYFAETYSEEVYHYCYDIGKLLKEPVSQ
jgi:hypothetical protein